MLGHFKPCKEAAAFKEGVCPICGNKVKTNVRSVHIEECRTALRAFNQKNDTKQGEKVAKQKVPGFDVVLKSVPAISLAEGRRILCKFCQVPVREEDQEHHMMLFHSRNDGWRPSGTVHRFSFVLLPPSEERLLDVIERYRRLSKTHPHSLTGANFDWERLNFMETLNPVARYIGTKSWKGYVVFEFRNSENVILECPRTGNATYVLDRGWRNTVTATKRELRTEFKHVCAWIIHGANWEHKARQAVLSFKEPLNKSRVAHR
jgi:hypothetical protein